MTAAAGIGMRDLMRHAVGKDGFRNHFAAIVNDDDWKSWETLVGIGLAVRGKTMNQGEMQLFHVSEAGVAFLRKLWPRRYKRELKGAK